MLHSDFELAPGPATSIFNSVIRVYKYMRDALARSAARRAARKVAAELDEMPDHLLSDIGLDRMQLRAYALGHPVRQKASLSTNMAEAPEHPSNGVAGPPEYTDNSVVIDVGVQLFTIITKSRSDHPKSAARH